MAFGNTTDIFDYDLVQGYDYIIGPDTRDIVSSRENIAEAGVHDVDATDAHRDNVVDPCDVVVNSNNDISSMDEDENASDDGDTNIDTKSSDVQLAYCRFHCKLPKEFEAWC